MDIIAESISSSWAIICHRSNLMDHCRVFGGLIHTCFGRSEDFRAEKVDSAVLASVSNNIKRDGNGKSSCDAGTILLSITRMSYLKGKSAPPACPLFKSAYSNTQRKR